jgi:integrase
MSWHRVWFSIRKGKRRTIYALRWFGTDGRVRTESVGTDKKLAERLRRQREAELNTGTYQEVRPIGLGAFITEHLTLMQGQVRSSTLDGERIVLNRFLAHCGERDLSTVTARLAEGYFAARLQAVRTPTANPDLRILKAVFQAAVRRGYLRENPWRHVKQVKEAEKEIRVLTAAEVERLLAACPTLMWRVLVFILVTTGLRRGEALALEWRDVDLDNGLLHVRCKDGHRTKSGRNRIVPLVPAAIALLRALQAEASGSHVFETERGPVGLNRVREFREIVRAAGIPACTLHDLCRTYVSSLAMAGVNEAVAQKPAGHASIGTTLTHYTGILPEALMAAPLRLPYAEAGNGVSTLYREQSSALEPVVNCSATVG